MSNRPVLANFNVDAPHQGGPTEPAPLRVLIVEDSLAVTCLIEAALRSERMATTVALSGAQAIDAKWRVRPNVVLVDLGLPDMHGLELVRRFAADGDCGIIVVTAHDAEGARVAGLETGADDYIIKPPPLKELAARIRAVHRRVVARPPARPPVLVTVDCAYRRLSGPGDIATPLTEAEFAALVTLLEADGASVSREWLGRLALKRSITSDDRSVDQLVLKLRRKLSLHGVTDRCILSSRGLGYVVPDPGRFLISSGDEAPRPNGAEAAPQTREGG